MFSLRFRSRLILAMTLVVVGVTAVMLWVTRQRLQEAYAKVFSNQFESQLGFFTLRQQHRLEELETLCSSVAKSESFIRALTSEDPRAALAVAEAGLFKSPPSLPAVGLPSFGLPPLGLLPELTLPLRPGSPPRPVLSRSQDQGVSLILLDAKGSEIKPPEASPRGNANQERRRLKWKFTEETLVKLVRSRRAGKLSQQQTGFIGIGDEDLTDDQPTQLKEFVITPIRPRADDENNPAPPLGALLVALSYSSLEDFSKSVFGEHSELGAMQSGLWINGKIFSKSIPTGIAKSLAKEIEDEVNHHEVGDGMIPQSIQGRPYRAIYRELNPGSPFGIRACQVGLFSLAEAEAEQAGLFRIILASGALALAGAMVAILVLSRGLVKPIHALVRAAEEIGEGNYEVRVKVKSDDELGQLSASFNQMAKGLALNRKYHAVLTQVADKGIAKALMRGEVTLGGELRQVSVLFCDVRGFTRLTEGMCPQDVVLLLNEHMTEMTRIVHRHHGVVDKFVGDLIMAIFGAPVARPDDIANAARCALEMQGARAELNRSSRFQLDIGIGLTTGTALVGCMGSIHRLDYTVLGERVNLASRLCDAAAPQEILIDATTQEALAGDAETEPCGNLPLKGFAESTLAWRLLRVGEGA